jgi:hypothetical protein
LNVPKYCPKEREVRDRSTDYSPRILYEINIVLSRKFNQEKDILKAKNARKTNRESTANDIENQEKDVSHNPINL